MWTRRPHQRDRSASRFHCCRTSPDSAFTFLRAGFGPAVRKFPLGDRGLGDGTHAIDEAS